MLNPMVISVFLNFDFHNGILENLDFELGGFGGILTTNSTMVDISF